MSSIRRSSQFLSHYATKQLVKNLGESIGKAAAGSLRAEGAAVGEIKTPHTPGSPAPRSRGLVVVTGAAGGIGSATARCFAEHGYTVALVDLNPTALKKLASECAELSPLDDAANSAIALPCHVTDSGEVDEMLKKAASFGGNKIDGLAHLPGKYKQGKILETTSGDAAEMMDINFTATYNVLKGALPYLRKSANPTAQVITSIAGQDPIPGETPYCVPKMAQDGLVRCAQKDHREEGIKIVPVRLGPVATKMAEGRGLDLTKMLQPDDVALDLVQRQGKPRSMLTDEVRLTPSQAVGGDKY